MPDEIQTHDKAKAAARVNQASVARLAPKVFSTKVCSTRPTKSRPRSPGIPARLDQALERQKAIAKEACATGCCARDCGTRGRSPPSPPPPHRRTAS